MPVLAPRGRSVPAACDAAALSASRTCGKGGGCGGVKCAPAQGATMRSRHGEGDMTCQWRGVLPATSGGDGGWRLEAATPAALQTGRTAPELCDAAPWRCTASCGQRSGSPTAAQSGRFDRPWLPAPGGAAPHSALKRLQGLRRVQHAGRKRPGVVHLSPQGYSPL
jgi:hypothetical protein